MSDNFDMHRIHRLARKYGVTFKLAGEMTFVRQSNERGALTATSSLISRDPVFDEIKAVEAALLKMQVLGLEQRPNLTFSFFDSPGFNGQECLLRNDGTVINIKAAADKQSINGSRAVSRFHEFVFHACHN